MFDTSNGMAYIMSIGLTTEIRCKTAGQYCAAITVERLLRGIHIMWDWMGLMIVIVL